jgi:hypothetical protein
VLQNNALPVLEQVLMVETPSVDEDNDKEWWQLFWFGSKGLATTWEYYFEKVWTPSRYGLSNIVLLQGAWCPTLEPMFNAAWQHCRAQLSQDRWHEAVAIVATWGCLKDYHISHLPRKDFIPVLDKIFTKVAANRYDGIVAAMNIEKLMACPNCPVSMRHLQLAMQHMRCIPTVWARLEADRRFSMMRELAVWSRRHVLDRDIGEIHTNMKGIRGKVLRKELRSILLR